jgi:hypothetical protein
MLALVGAQLNRAEGAGAMADLDARMLSARGDRMLSQRGERADTGGTAMRRVNDVAPGYTTGSDRPPAAYTTERPAYTTGASERSGYTTGASDAVRVAWCRVCVRARVCALTRATAAADDVSAAQHRGLDGELQVSRMRQSNARCRACVLSIVTDVALRCRCIIISTIWMSTRACGIRWAQ